MIKYKVYKVTPDKQQTLDFQFEVSEARPGTDPCDLAVNYLLSHVSHNDVDKGIAPLIDSDGVHLTQWVVLDDADIYWFIPGGRLLKNPKPIALEAE